MAEAESILRNASTQTPLDLPPGVKIGMYHCNRRGYPHIQSHDHLTPFMLNDEAQQLTGQDGLDAINNICLMYPSIKDAIRDMRPEFFLVPAQHAR